MEGFLSSKRHIAIAVIIAVIMILFLARGCRGVSGYPLKFTIAVDKEVCRINDDIEVTLDIKNVAKNNIAIEVGPNFVLEGGKIFLWAPIRLDGKEMNRSVNRRSRLLLKPRERRTLKYSLEKLKWDHTLSSIWPSKSFRALIIPDKYTLYFEVEIPEGPLSKRFSSNKVLIELVK